MKPDTAPATSGQRLFKAFGNSFEEAIVRRSSATSNARNQDLTAFGHSYGSLTTSLALPQGAPVDNVVLYGSPGGELTDAAQLYSVDQR